ARPTISTPLGAISPGATGMRQGPFGTHSVPTWPMSQLAAGMQSPKPARNAAVKQALPPGSAALLPHHVGDGDEGREEHRAEDVGPADEGVPEPEARPGAAARHKEAVDGDDH